MYATQNLLLARAAASGLGRDGAQLFEPNENRQRGDLPVSRARRAAERGADGESVRRRRGWDVSEREWGGRPRAGRASATASAALERCDAATASALSGLSGALCQTLLQSGETTPAKMTLEMAITGAPMVLMVEKAARVRFCRATRSRVDAGDARAGDVGGDRRRARRGDHETSGVHRERVRGGVWVGVDRSVTVRRGGPQRCRLRVACLFVIVASTVAHTTHPYVNPYVERRRRSPRRKSKSKRA